jgi:hypothetical protein
MRFFAVHGLIVASVLAFSATSVVAQTGGFDPNSGSYDVDAPERRGQAGMSWLQIGGSARTEGMGGAAIGIKSEPSLVFYNPAGAASVRGAAVFANITRWPGDVRVNHFTALSPLGPVVLGASFQSVDFGTITGTVIEDLSDDNRSGYRETGNVEVGAWTAGLVLASQITDRFNVGVNVKFVVEDFKDTELYSFVTGQQGYTDKFNDNRVAVWALDIGTQYNTGLRNLAINMSFRNLAPTVNYVEQDFDLPLTYQIGFSFDAIEVITGIASERHRLHTEIVGVDKRDVPLDTAIGLEYTARLFDSDNDLEVSLRGGRRPARNQEGQLSVGGGIAGMFAGVRTQFDYSYNDYGEIFDAHRLSVTVYLDR